MNKIKFIIFNLILASFTINNSIYAQSIIRFDNREDWTNSLESFNIINIENFNSFNTDVDFGNSSLNTGKLTILDRPLSFSSNEKPPLDNNDISIDIFPYKDFATGIDNTPMINIDVNEQETVEFKFFDSFSAFGFDYELYNHPNRSFLGGELNILVNINNSLPIVGNIIEYPAKKGFIGYIINSEIAKTDGFDIFYNGPFGDNLLIAIDNINGANPTNVTVSEPNTISSLLITSLLILSKFVLNNKKQNQ